jgi:hypothetical protein
MRPIYGQLAGAQVPLSDRAAQASSSLVQYDKNRNLARLLSSAGMVKSSIFMGLRPVH